MCEKDVAEFRAEPESAPLAERSPGVKTMKLATRMAGEWDKLAQAAQRLRH
jgi:hypothetical protein